MNISLSLFVSRFGDIWSAGGYFQDPINAEHHFFGEIADNEESVVMSIFNAIDNEFEELGQIEVITTSTKLLNFLHKGESAKEAPPAPAIKALLGKMNKTKGSRFKKNIRPSMDDVIAVSRSDMMNCIIRRLYDLKDQVSVYNKYDPKLKELTKSAPKSRHCLMGTRVFHWGETEEVNIEGKALNVYFSGMYTPKTDSKKKDRNVDEVEKKLRQRLYTYYTGSNSKLTDAGQRSLDETRSVTLSYEKIDLIERFFDIQDTGIEKLPITPVYMGNLEKILGGASSNRILNGDVEWFSYVPDCGDMVYNGLSRSDISYVFYPQRLGPRIRNQFLSLQSKLIGHLTDTPIGKEIDVTDLFVTYSTNAKGKTVCEGTEVLNGKFNFVKMMGMEYDDRKFNLKYVFDIDGPSPKVFKALAKYNPKISIVFESLSDVTVGYYTIVRTDVGISIYSCPEGSKLIRRPK